MSRRPLTREAIFAAALGLIDDEGIDALTMRRLARVLRVGTMSLYSYIPNKEDVLDGVVGAVAGEMVLPEAAQSWRDAAHFMLSEFRRVCGRHPNVVPLLIQRPPTSIQGTHLIEAGFDHLRRAGVDEKTTAQAYRLVVAYAIGFVSLETSGFFTATGPVAMRHAYEPDAFPRVAEMAPYLVKWDPDEEFTAGLEVILGFVAGHTSGEGDG